MEIYLLQLIVMIGIYSIMAYSLNLVTGYGGLLAFCIAGFYGVGAYTYALLRLGSQANSFHQPLLFTASLSFFTAMLGAALAGGLAAFLIGMVALRFRGDLFVFSTLGFQMILFAVLHNWTSLGRGAPGLDGIPRPEILGWYVNEIWEYAVLVGVVNALLLPFLFVLYRSPFGLSLKALRENERAAESLGISAFRQHLSAFVILGIGAAIAGALYASYIGHIDPSSFGLGESIFMIALLLLGGSGNIRGPIIGAVAMVILPALLSFSGVFGTIEPNMREIIYGLVLVVLMYWRSQGLAGDYALG